MLTGWIVTCAQVQKIVLGISCIVCGECWKQAQKKEVKLFSLHSHIATWWWLFAIGEHKQGVRYVLYIRHARA